MDSFWILFLFLFGACIGSFLNVVICRMPRGESIVLPGSHCLACGRSIRWHDNIPLLSWVILRGRCRFCGVSISPRYLIIEFLTAVLVVGLYVALYMLHLRENTGEFLDSWPFFVAHAALLCGLLACSVIDIRYWLVPLEVCWFVSAVGIVSNTLSPVPNLVPPVNPTLGGICVGASVGLVLANLLLRRGWILPSFIDAEGRPDNPMDHPPVPLDEPPPSPKQEKAKPKQVAITSAHGVNPRREILREVLFLLPVLLGGATAWAMLTYWPTARQGWLDLHALAGGRVGLHLHGLFGSVFGFFVGGGLIWAMRIFGTLGFGKEAMGLGDVHLMAAVGAVTGWIVPTMAFFLAPIFGLLWALYLLARRGQVELPYGPWLSAGALAAILLHDPITQALGPYQSLVDLFW